MRVLTHADYKTLGRGGANGFRRHLLEELRTHPASWIDAYVTDETVLSLAAELDMQPLCDPGASLRGNNKRLFHQFMESAGHPVFETSMASAPEEVAACLKQLARSGYQQAGIKAAIGASGIGLMTAPTSGPAPCVPEYFFHEGACMVQGWLEPGRGGVLNIASPSVQLFLDDDTVYLYDLTEQILSDASIHQGNESPPLYLDEHGGLTEALFGQASDAGAWLHRQGYRGTASVDFLVAFTATGFEAFGCEINARVTGATYPSVLARHYLPRGGWLMRNLRLKQPVAGADVLQLRDQHGHLFRKGATEGILPINFNLDSDDLVTKGQFLCLGESSKQCHQLLDAANQDLALDWDYDRD